MSLPPSPMCNSNIMLFNFATGYQECINKLTKTCKYICQLFDGFSFLDVSNKYNAISKLSFEGVSIRYSRSLDSHFHFGVSEHNSNV